MVGQDVGATHHRQICLVSKSSGASVQQPIQGPAFERRGRFSPARLAGTQQFCQRPLLPTSAGLRRCVSTGRDGHCHSAVLAGSTIRRAAATAVNLPPACSTSFATPLFSAGGSARASTKPSLAVLRLEDLWTTRLKEEGWSQRASLQLPVISV